MMTRGISRRAAVTTLISAPLIARAQPAPVSPLPTKPSTQKIAAVAPAPVTVRLEHCTAPINVVEVSGAQGTATSFVTSLFETPENNVPILVTNKHVFQGMVSGSIRFSKRGVSGDASLTEFADIAIPNFESHWYGHPDPTVDLGFVPLLTLLHHVGADPASIFWETIPQSAIPDSAFLSTIDPVTDLLVIGYPAGIADVEHNLPIFRRGITASSAALRFQGRRSFAIDCEIWPGSSGSPVFLYYSGAVPHPPSLEFTIGTEVRLLGVISEALEQNVDGAATIAAAPLKTAPVHALVPNGLGICVSSQAILDFEEIVRSWGYKPPADYVPRKAVD